MLTVEISYCSEIAQVGTLLYSNMHLHCDFPNYTKDILVVLYWIIFSPYRFIIPINPLYVSLIPDVNTRSYI